MLILTSTEIRTKFSVKNFKLLQIFPACCCNTCIKMNCIELPWLYSLKGSCIVLKEIAHTIEKQMLVLDSLLKIADASILWMVYEYPVIRHNICWWRSTTHIAADTWLTKPCQRPLTAFCSYTLKLFHLSKTKPIKVYIKYYVRIRTIFCCR